MHKNKLGHLETRTLHDAGGAFVHAVARGGQHLSRVANVAGQQVDVVVVDVDGAAVRHRRFDFVEERGKRALNAVRVASHSDVADAQRLKVEHAAIAKEERRKLPARTVQLEYGLCWL